MENDMNRMQLKVMRWGYLEEKWGRIRAHLDCRAAVNAVESVIA